MQAASWPVDVELYSCLLWIGIEAIEGPLEVRGIDIEAIEGPLKVRGKGFNCYHKYVEASTGYSSM